MRRIRLLLAATVVGSVAVSGATAAVDAARPQTCGGHVSDDGKGWKAIRPPFPAGPHAVQQAVATAYVPDRIYVTNGSAVMRTDDGGCTWHTLVVPDPGSRLGLLPEPIDGLLKIPSTAHIASIAAPSSATATDRIYVGLNDVSALGSQPRIAFFDGRGWHLSTGLPSFGTVRELTATANIATSVYALVDPASGLSSDGGLYASGNGGASFTQRDAAARSSTLHDLKADPIVNTVIYGLGPGGLRASRDGGIGFAPAGRPASDIRSYDVSSGEGSVRFVVGHAARKSYDRSNDAGSSFISVTAPVRARQVAIQPILDQVAVSDGHQLWLERGDALPLAHNVTPAHGAPTSQLQFTAPLASGYSLVGVRAGVLLRSVFTLAGRLLPSVGDQPIQLLPQAPPHQFPSTLTPSRSRVALPPGAHRDVHYRLLLPRTPSPVDVMFLVDTSSSTENTIAGLKRDLAGIVNDLSNVGLDTQFGVGDFKDYSPTVADLGDGEIGDYAYRLDRVIGPADDALRLALDRLHASGGGDPAESQLTALYQSTTGAGQHYPGRRSYIKDLHPGIGADYRQDSLRLAVLATDDRFHRERNYLTPSWAKTVAALRSHQVHPIGLAMESVDDQTFQTKGFRSLRMEQQLGTASGSFAPPGGVDCNGDLVPDVAAGAPFVCKVPVVVSRAVSIGPVRTKPHVLPVKLGPAITRAAETLPDMKAVGLRFSGAPTGIARLLHPTTLPQVNLKNDNSLHFTVRYSCPRLHKPKSYDIGVDAAAGVRVVARSQMKVLCGAVGTPPTHRVPPPAAAVALAAPAAAAPAPPAPGNPIPNANPNPNPAINANVGFAGQEEEQRQLAFAGADAGVEPEPGSEMAMSRLGGRGAGYDPAAAEGGSGGSAETWLFGATALMLTAGAGYAARRRSQLALARTAGWHRRG